MPKRQLNFDYHSNKIRKINHTSRPHRALMGTAHPPLQNEGCVPRHTIPLYKVVRFQHIFLKPLQMLKALHSDIRSRFHLKPKIIALFILN